MTTRETVLALAQLVADLVRERDEAIGLAEQRQRLGENIRTLNTALREIDVELKAAGVEPMATTLSQVRELIRQRDVARHERDELLDELADVRECLDAAETTGDSQMRPRDRVALVLVQRDGARAERDALRGVTREVRS
jgi:uncharacterized coiled-coil DUF342 family protein